jgi:carbohydrate ABC transporter substrate-binding protein, CUT1 family (TC 3.A.1.1.-)
MQQQKSTMQPWTALAVAAALGVGGLGSAQAMTDAQRAAAEAIIEEAQPSTLTRDEQMEQLEWFVEAAEPFQGMDVSVVSETIATHEYESNVLAKHFSDLTGINLTHNLIGEGDVIEALQTEMQSGESIYAGYVNDADLIGTHYRYGQVVPLSDYMEGEGADVTSPYLDLDDFIGLDAGLHRTASCISFLISSSPTSTGSVMTGSSAKTCRHSSKTSMAMSWVCR